jgi:hypothetical protein
VLTFFLSLGPPSSLLPGQQKFDIYKSYANAKVKPPQYGKNINRPSRFAISEYLTPVQKKMMVKRTSPDQPQDQFDGNWSGYNLKINANKANSIRRLTEQGVKEEEVYQNRISSSSSSWSQWGASSRYISVGSWFETLVRGDIWSALTISVILGISIIISCILLKRITKIQESEKLIMDAQPTIEETSVVAEIV